MVGLIGMVGIIINDSIVLITTIDEYAKDRGVVQAITDGVVDRFRPVLLTTLTTVLGLTPLLSEQSVQAQFLKPTVITLVYGLGFGFLLVLVVVPALRAMQADIGAQIQAAKRALWGATSGRGPVLPTTVVSLMLAGGFVATFGYTAITGELLLPLFQTMADRLAPLTVATVTFIACAAVITLCSYVVIAVQYGVTTYRHKRGA